MNDILLPSLSFEVMRPITVVIVYSIIPFYFAMLKKHQNVENGLVHFLRADEDSGAAQPLVPQLLCSVSGPFRTPKLSDFRRGLDILRIPKSTNCVVVKT